MFKTILSYPNYEVNSSGHVRNKTTGHNMKWIDNGKGYKMVKLYNGMRPQGRLCLVHRLVLATHSPIEESLDVNHIDGDKANNILSNLEWVTKSENTRHAHTTGLFKNKLTIPQVLELKILLKHNTDYGFIATQYNVSHATIWKIANGILYDYV
jgi:hypothetical protein